MQLRQYKIQSIDLLYRSCSGCVAGVKRFPVLYHILVLIIKFFSGFVKFIWGSLMKTLYNIFLYFCKLLLIFIKSVLCDHFAHTMICEIYWRQLMRSKCRIWQFWPWRNMKTLVYLSCMCAHFSGGSFCLECVIIYF